MFDALSYIKLALKKPNIAIVICLWMVSITTLGLSLKASKADDALLILGYAGPIVILFLVLNNIVEAKMGKKD